MYESCTDLFYNHGKTMAVRLEILCDQLCLWSHFLLSRTCIDDMHEVTNKMRPTVGCSEIKLLNLSVRTVFLGSNRLKLAKFHPYSFSI